MRTRKVFQTSVQLFRRVCEANIHQGCTMHNTSCGYALSAEALILCFQFSFLFIPGVSGGGVVWEGVGQMLKTWTNARTHNRQSPPQPTQPAHSRVCTVSIDKKEISTSREDLQICAPITGIVPLSPLTAMLVCSLKRRKCMSNFSVHLPSRPMLSIHQKAEVLRV